MKKVIWKYICNEEKSFFLYFLCTSVCHSSLSVCHCQCHSKPPPSLPVYRSISCLLNLHYSFTHSSVFVTRRFFIFPLSLSLPLKAIATTTTWHTRKCSLSLSPLWLSSFTDCLLASRVAHSLCVQFCTAWIMHALFILQNHVFSYKLTPG